MPITDLIVLEYRRSVQESILSRSGREPEYLDFFLTEVEHHFDELEELKANRDPHFYAELIDLGYLACIVCTLTGNPFQPPEESGDSFPMRLAAIRKQYHNSVIQRGNADTEFSKFMGLVFGAVEAEQEYAPIELVAKRAEKIQTKMREATR